MKENKHGTRNGMGTYTCADGRKMEGKWKENGRRRALRMKAVLDNCWKNALAAFCSLFGVALLYSLSLYGMVL